MGSLGPEPLAALIGKYRLLSENHPLGEDMNQHNLNNRTDYRFILIEVFVIILAVLTVAGSPFKDEKIQKQHINDFKIPMYGYAEEVKPFFLPDGCIKKIRLRRKYQLCSFPMQ